MENHSEMINLKSCFYFWVLILLLLSIKAPAQNLLIADSSFSHPGDTVVIGVAIENTNPFVSFQFDMQLPENTFYVGSSVQLSSRTKNHVILGNLIENNTLRVISYSPDNSVFQGNSGGVLTFKLALGIVDGELPLLFSNAIIGDNLSTNILTDTKSGKLVVSPLGINENRNPPIKFRIFPNPVVGNSVLEFSLIQTSAVKVTLIDNLGRNLATESLGLFAKGKHCINIPKKIFSVFATGKMYHIGIEANPLRSGNSVAYIKIIR